MLITVNVSSRMLDVVLLLRLNDGEKCCEIGVRPRFGVAPNRYFECGVGGREYPFDDDLAGLAGSKCKIGGLFASNNDRRICSNGTFVCAPVRASFL